MADLPAWQAVAPLNWIDCVLASGVTIVAGYQATLQAAVDSLGLGHLRGVINQTGLAAGTLVFTPPAATRPATKRRCPVTVAGDHGFGLDVNIDGTCRVAETAWITGNVGLDGVNFSL